MPLRRLYKLCFAHSGRFRCEHLAILGEQIVEFLQFVFPAAEVWADFRYITAEHHSGKHGRSALGVLPEVGYSALHSKQQDFCDELRARIIVVGIQSAEQFGFLVFRNSSVVKY